MSALIRFALTSAASAALAAACRARVEYPAAPPPPPPPAEVRGAAAKGDFAGVPAYARTLSYDTVAGAGDRQRLMTGTRCPPWTRGGNCRYGALARIQPQMEAHQIPDTLDLAAGRVVARIFALDSAYAKLNLRPNDTTYWWIDRPRADGPWRSVLVSSNPRVAAVVDTNAVWHPAAAERRYTWRQAIARFVWRERDEALWVTCTMYGCCQSAADELAQ